MQCAFFFEYETWKNVLSKVSLNWVEIIDKTDKVEMLWNF